MGPHSPLLSSTELWAWLTITAEPAVSAELLHNSGFSLPPIWCCGRPVSSLRGHSVDEALHCPPSYAGMFVSLLSPLAELWNDSEC